MTADYSHHLVMRRSIVNKLPVEMRCYTSTVWALTLNNDVSTTMVDYIVIPEDKVGATPDIVKSQVMKYAKDNWDVKFFKPQTSVSQ